MTFDDYQAQAAKTAIYPGIGENFVYPTLGLVGEAGEVAEKVKKIIRDHDGKLSPEIIEEIKKELGDVLWYLSQLCSELKLPLSQVAQKNLAKLASRQARELLHGSGDNR
jgi:NTP pyrophosphatase (non-canonical NTP hydrolase)